MTREMREGITGMGMNPFIVGTPVPPAQFYGRRDQIINIKDRIGDRYPQCVSIVGFRRSGKSSLLRYVRERINEFCAPEQHPLVISLSLSDRRFHTPQGITEGLRRTIQQATGNTPWQSEDNDDPWAVDDGLQALCDTGRRLIVLMDEFEQIGTRLEAFEGWGEDWREKASAQGYFSLVISTVRPIDEIYKNIGLTSPFGNIFTTTELGTFALDEWKSLIYNSFSSVNMVIRDAEFHFIDEVAGGFPFYTQLAASLIWRYKDLSRVREEYLIQVEPHFKALWNELTELEHQTLRHSANIGDYAKVRDYQISLLQRRGLLRPNGKPFSSTFIEFMRSQS